MSFKRISGQSVKLLRSGESDFNTRNKCTGFSKKICQPVGKGMTTSFQVALEPITGEELLTNSEFTNNLDDWNPGEGPGLIEHSTEYGGSMEFFSGASGIYEVQDVTLDTNSYYYIESKFRDVQPPNSINPAISELLPSIAGYTGSSLSYSLGDRVARVWFDSLSNTSADINVRIDGTGFVEYVRLVELTKVTAKLKTCEGVEVMDLPVRYFEDRAIITVQWDLVEDDCGCYQICVTPDGDTTTNFVACQNGIIDGNGNLILDANGNCILG